MAKFITRVELYDVAHQHPSYQLLHDEMEARGFSRIIQSKDDVWYHLPPAEYAIETTLTRHQVLALAKEAAGETQRKFGVLVAQYSRMTWSGLKELSAAEVARILA